MGDTVVKSACEQGYDCHCASAVVGGSIIIGSTTYIGADDPETVAGAGQVKLTSSGGDTACSCDFHGVLLFYASDGEGSVDYNDSITLNVDVTIHDTDVVYAEIATEGITFVGLVSSTPLHRPVVRWSLYGYCPGAEPPNPPPENGLKGFPDVVSFYLYDKEKPTCDYISLRIVGDWACRIQCIVTTGVDEDGVPHLSHCYGDETKSECPNMGVVEWPWPKNGWREREDPNNDPYNEFWDYSWVTGTGEDRIYDSIYAKDQPLLEESDLPHYCELSICDLMRGGLIYDINGIANFIRLADWWEVTDDNGWSTQPPPDWPPEGSIVYCFEWCNETYYKVASEDGLEEEDMPHLKFKPVCSPGIYRIIAEDEQSEELGEVPNEMTGIPGESVYEGAHHLRIQSLSYQFVRDSQGDIICDSEGEPETEEYWQDCVGSLTPNIPSVNISNFCYICTDRCGLSVDIQVSWTGPDTQKTLFGKVWHKSETGEFEKHVFCGWGSKTEDTECHCWITGWHSCDKICAEGDSISGTFYLHDNNSNDPYALSLQLGGVLKKFLSGEIACAGTSGGEGNDSICISAYGSVEWMDNTWVEYQREDYSTYCSVSQPEGEDPNPPWHCPSRDESVIDGFSSTSGHLTAIGLSLGGISGSVSNVVGAEVITVGWSNVREGPDFGDPKKCFWW
jgi:hypothetical protein